MTDTPCLADRCWSPVACGGFGYCRQRNFKTAYWAKPIPTSKFDWTAWIDGEEEAGPYGYGPTEAEAIADLKVELAEREA